MALSPTFRSLSNHNYRLYVAGSLVSNTGTWMQRVAQDWLVLTLGGGGIGLGITTGLQFLPILLLSPYAGVIADRFPKRRLLQVTQAWMAVAALLLGVLAVTEVAQIWHVYVIAFAFGIGAAFDGPARQSFVSEMVGRDDLSNAVGLNSAAFNLARIVGPALAGLLIHAFGDGTSATGWVILVNAVSYLAVIAQLARMDRRALHTPDLVERRPGALLEGVRYVRSQPRMVLVLILVFFAGTFGMNFQITSALMATEVFGKGAGEFGVLGSAMAVGSLTGALLSARRVTDPAAAARRRGRGVRRRRDRGRLAALVPRVRAVLPVHRPRHPHPAQLGQRHHAAHLGTPPAGPGDGAVHDDRDGRDADRCPDRRPDRQHAGRPVGPGAGRHLGAGRGGRGRRRLRPDDRWLAAR